MTEGGTPILAKAAQIERQDAGSEVGAVGVGQDQKAGIVGDQMQALGAQQRRPTDPAITRTTAQRRRLLADQRQPLIAAMGDIAQLSPHEAAKAQVVVTIRQGIPPRPLVRLGGSHPNIRQSAGGRVVRSCLHGRFYNASGRKKPVQEGFDGCSTGSVGV